jgi:hypothetical protein
VNGCDRCADIEVERDLLRRVLRRIASCEIPAPHVYAETILREIEGNE